MSDYKTKNVLINFPIPVLEQIDSIAKSEHRTRAEFVREAVRRHIKQEYPVRVNPPRTTMIPR